MPIFRDGFVAVWGMVIFMRMQILTENRVKKRGLLAEHGLSLYIEHENGNILFDTGQSDVYCRNALQMGVDLKGIDFIVLSHGHYDHCGGLVCFPELEQFPTVYVHRTAFEQRYAANCDGKTYREIGIPWSLDEHTVIKNHMIFTQRLMRIAPEISLYSEIPYTTDFEGVPNGFYTGNIADRIVDRMQDEQVLVIESGKNLFVFLGCSHPGIINCLSYVQNQYPGKRIKLLVAGMHLEGASSHRLQLTMQALKEMNIEKIIPVHCTGTYAISEMKRFFGEQCLPLCTGDSMEF